MREAARFILALALWASLAANSGDAVPTRRVFVSSFGDEPKVRCDDGDDCSNSGSGPVVFSVRHSYSHLPGSSFHSLPGKEKHVVTQEHAALWRKHDRLRYGRSLAALGDPGNLPGAFYQLGGNAEPTIAG